jgi:putative acetyltransferase
MNADLNIRESTQYDVAAIESLYPKAFPDEDLLPVVRALLEEPEIGMSLVAIADSNVAAHVFFTRCEVEGCDIKTALLAPLAVTPACQRQGIGTSLVRDGLQRLQETGVQLVCVLGDPAYYSRLGFESEALVEPPYALPAEWEGAWQSQYLGDDAKACAGKLSVPPQWQHRELWAPA